MAYLMDSQREAGRLLLKSEADTTRHQLQLTGLTNTMHCLDAGGGAGFVTKIMSELVGSGGHVVLADASEDRLASAREYTQECSNISFLQTNLEKIALDSQTMDYVFCRFVFEYLEQPDAVFEELFRLVKPGGRLVVGDLDNNILSHYPLDPSLEGQYNQIVQALINKKLWDPFMGRKLYKYFYDHGLEDVQVHLIPHHLFYGEIQEKDARNMELKIEQIQEMQENGDIQLDFDVKKFQSNFMKFFRSPARFSYSPLILVEGRRRAT